MWWHFFALFIATTAVSADEFEGDSSSCSNLVDFECVTGVAKPQFPGNEEELEEFCKYSLDYFNCTEHVLNRCGGNDEDFRQRVGEYESNVRFNCKKYSIRYNAIVNALPCLKKNRFTIAYCHPSLRMDMVSFEAGLTSMAMSWDDPICLNNLYFLGCVVAGTSELCGDGTRATVVDIMQDFTTIFEGCPSYAKYFLHDIGKMMQTEAHRKLNVSETT